MATENPPYTLSGHAYERMLTRSKQSPVWLEEILKQGHFVHLPNQASSGRRYALVHDAYCDAFLVAVIAPDTYRVITVLSQRYYETACGRILPHYLRLARSARYKLQLSLARTAEDTPPPAPESEAPVEPVRVERPVHSRLRPGSCTQSALFPTVYELGTHIGRSLAHRLADECEQDVWGASWSLWAMTTGRPLEEGLRFEVPLRLRHASIGNALLARARETWVQELVRGDEPMDFRNQLRLFLSCKHFPDWLYKRMSTRPAQAVANIDRILITSEVDLNQSYVDVTETVALLMDGQSCGSLQVKQFQFAPPVPAPKVRKKSKAAKPDADSEQEPEDGCLETCG